MTEPVRDSGTPGSSPRALAIPHDQWDAPVSFSAKGQALSLRQFLDPASLPLEWSQLTPQQHADLTAQRIALRPKFDLILLGAGRVNKERALAEVRAQTQVGRLLIEIEYRMIHHLIEQARAERLGPQP
jgi:hypothetical protein